MQTGNSEDQHTIEITDSRNVILAVLANNIAGVTDNNRCVPEGPSMGIVPLQYRRHYHHIEPLRQTLCRAGDC